MPDRRPGMRTPSPGGCSYVKWISPGDQGLPSPGGLVCRMGVLHPVDLQMGYHPVAGRCQVNGMKRKQPAQVQAAADRLREADAQPSLAVGGEREPDVGERQACRPASPQEAEGSRDDGPDDVGHRSAQPPVAEADGEHPGIHLHPGRPRCDAERQPRQQVARGEAEPSVRLAQSSTTERPAC